MHSILGNGMRTSLFAPLIALFHRCATYILTNMRVICKEGRGEVLKTINNDEARAVLKKILGEALYA